MSNQQFRGRWARGVPAGALVGMLSAMPGACSTKNGDASEAIAGVDSGSPRSGTDGIGGMGAMSGTSGSSGESAVREGGSMEVTSGDAGYDAADANEDHVVSDSGNAVCTMSAPTDAAAGPSSPPYAACYGCHPALFAPQEYEGTGSVPACLTDPYANAPTDLPCGSCSHPDQKCAMGVRVLCDCDGDGPLPPYFDGDLVDQWLCACVSGTWSCWIYAPSGSSCRSCFSHDP